MGTSDKLYQEVADLGIAGLGFKRRVFDGLGSSYFVYPGYERLTVLKGFEGPYIEKDKHYCHKHNPEQCHPQIGDCNSSRGYLTDIEAPRIVVVFWTELGDFWVPSRRYC